MSPSRAGGVWRDQDWRGNDLQGADFRLAVLRQCRLDGARAADSCWDGARLEDSSAEGMDLSGASLRETHLSETAFTRAILRGARLDGSVGEGIGLRGADLREAVLRDARWGDADLRGADLRGADFTGARMHHADLRGALLEGAVLDGADFAGATRDTEVLPAPPLASALNRLLVAVPQLPASTADAAQARAWLDEAMQLMQALQTEKPPADAGATLARTQALLDRVVPGWQAHFGEADWQGIADAVRRGDTPPS